MIELLRKIAYREGFGNILADGVDAAAKKIGNQSERFALTIKGQECEIMPQRNLYVCALGLATSETGPDHTRWYPPYAINPATFPIEKLEEYGWNIDLEKAYQSRLPEGKGRLLKWLTDSRAALESMPTCLSIWRGKYHVDLNYWANILEAGTGIDFTYQKLLTIGDRIMNIERAFNIREGFRRKDDTIPIRMQTEAQPQFHYGPLTSEKLNYMLDEYYGEREWDLNTSIPTRKKLEELSLKYVIEDLIKNNIEVK
jgi:aldehyde:ferredoxin oxidoreductase